MASPRVLKGAPKIKWPELIPGTLLRRYKRFLADIRLEGGREITAHCPNTGSMQGCSEPGRRVYVSFHDNPKRKLKYTWELIEMPTSLVGINTGIPNRLVLETLRKGSIEAFQGYETFEAEVRVGKNSRIDIVLGGNGIDRCFIEVKNCTLVEDGVALFPDAVTARGLKHLMELENLVAAGCRGAMFYLIQRGDAKRFRPASHIDPAYSERLTRAVRRGVEIHAYDVHIDLDAIRIHRPLEIDLDG
jgi:sugar fermentation stimulation protein A